MNLRIDGMCEGVALSKPIKMSAGLMSESLADTCATRELSRAMTDKLTDECSPEKRDDIS